MRRHRYLFIALCICLPLGRLAAQYSSSPSERSGAGEAVAHDSGLSLLLGTVTSYSEAAGQAVRRDLARFYAELDSAGTLNKVTHKALAALQQKISARYLKTYREHAGFDALFSQGHYNDATAAALYALVLGHYRVPFDLVSEPFQVYLLAAPDAIRIGAAHGRKKAEEEKFSSAYLLLVKELGLLRPGGASEASIFHAHYMPPRTHISLAQLAGILHYKEGLALYDRADFAAAFRLFEQAEALYPAPRHQVMLVACLFQLAQQYNLNEPDSYYWLLQLHRAHPLPQVRQELVSAFAVAAEALLNKQQQPQKAERLYRYFTTQLQGQPAVHRAVQSAYFTQQVRYHAERNAPDTVLAYMDSLYSAAPGDSAVQAIFTGLLLKNLLGTRRFEEGLAPLEAQLHRYPFLCQHPALCERHLYFQAERLRHTFERGDGEAGLAHLTAFEDCLARYGPVPKSEHWIKTAYLAAADYFVRAAQYPSALQMIERGLTLLPDDHYFVHRRNLLKNY